MFLLLGTVLYNSSVEQLTLANHFMLEKVYPPTPLPCSYHLPQSRRKKMMMRPSGMEGKLLNANRLILLFQVGPNPV